MTLYRCWVEDAEEAEDTDQHTSRQRFTMNADHDPTETTTPPTEEPGSGKGKPRGGKANKNIKNEEPGENKKKVKTPQQLQCGFKTSKRVY